MYKILIIDDEILIRELIKKSIDFNALYHSTKRLAKSADE